MLAFHLDEHVGSAQVRLELDDVAVAVLVDRVARLRREGVDGRVPVVAVEPTAAAGVRVEAVAVGVAAAHGPGHGVHIDVLQARVAQDRAVAVVPGVVEVHDLPRAPLADDDRVVAALVRHQDGGGIGRVEARGPDVVPRRGQADGPEHAGQDRMGRLAGHGGQGQGRRAAAGSLDGRDVDHRLHLVLGVDLVAVPLVGDEAAAVLHEGHEGVLARERHLGLVGVAVEVDDHLKARGIRIAAGVAALVRAALRDVVAAGLQRRDERARVAVLEVPDEQDVGGLGPQRGEAEERGEEERGAGHGAIVGGRMPGVQGRPGVERRGGPRGLRYRPAAMRHALPLVLLLLPSLGLADEPGDRPDAEDPIVNGDLEDEFPAVVSLGADFGNPFSACTGTLITHRVVLTAEDGRSKSFTLDLGSGEEARRIWHFDREEWVER